MVCDIVNLRFYKDKDYEQVKQTLKEGDLFDDVWEARNNLNKKIERDPESIILAEENNKIIGCVFIVEDGWNAFVWRLSVRKDYRKKGIGLELMKKAEEIIKQRGIKEASIFVSANISNLKKWYKNQSYTKTSDYTFMYKKL